MHVLHKLTILDISCSHLKNLPSLLLDSSLRTSSKIFALDLKLKSLLSCFLVVLMNLELNCSPAINIGMHYCKWQWQKKFWSLYFHDANPSGPLIFLKVFREDICVCKKSISKIFSPISKDIFLTFVTLSFQDYNSIGPNKDKIHGLKHLVEI